MITGPVSQSSTRSAAWCARAAPCAARPLPWRAVRSSSSSPAEGSFVRFLDRSLAALRRDLPWMYQRMCGLLAPREVWISVDGEPISVLCGANDLVLAGVPRDPSVRVETSTPAILDVLEARSTLVDSVLDERVRLRGRPEDLAAFHDGLLAYVEG